MSKTRDKAAGNSISLKKAGSHRTRRIGWEIEFAGLDLDQTANIVADCLGSEPEELTDYEVVCSDSDGGEWRIERDQDILKRLGRLSEEGNANVFDNMAETALRVGSELLVPIEVVSPPLPIEEMDLFDRVCKELAAAGAKGTTDNFVYAFGLHLNPEAPSLEADSIFSFLRAYACLQDWLFERAELDASRQLTRYTAPYPKKYVLELVTAESTPELKELMRTYLKYNATRNRALDMLPLFSEIDEALVAEHLDDPRIKSRPTYHFRLPNCDIDNADWSPLDAWQEWLYVEKLAADKALLGELCEFTREQLNLKLDNILADRHAEMDEWVRKNLSSE